MKIGVDIGDPKVGPAQHENHVPQLVSGPLVSQTETIQVDLLAREQALQHVRVVSAGTVQWESIVMDDCFLSCHWFECWKQGWVRQVLQDAVQAGDCCCSSSVLDIIKLYLLSI